MGCCAEKELQDQQQLLQDLCPLCYEPIRYKDCFRLKCTHQMHKKCYDQLVISNFNQCPMCRQIINSNISVSSDDDLYSDVDLDTIILIFTILSELEHLQNEIIIQQQQ